MTLHTLSLAFIIRFTKTAQRARKTKASNESGRMKAVSLDIAFKATVACALLVIVLYSSGWDDIIGSSDTRRNLAEQDEVSFPEKPATIVTAFFKLPEAPDRAFMTSMDNLLSMKDYMVIFTTFDLIYHIKKKRNDASDRTVIVPFELESTLYPQIFSKELWMQQKDLYLQESHRLLWVWLGKTWFVNHAIKKNFFNTEVFIWSDVGIFVDSKYNNKVFARHTELIHPRSMLMGAITTKKEFQDITSHLADQTNGWSLPWINIGIFQDVSCMAGYADVFQWFHREFLRVTKTYIENGWFVGNGVNMIQTACMINYGLCRFVTSDAIPGDQFSVSKYLMEGSLPPSHLLLPALAKDTKPPNLIPPISEAANSTRL
jgi:hypothetical protein